MECSCPLDWPTMTSTAIRQEHLDAVLRNNELAGSSPRVTALKRRNPKESALATQQASDSGGIHPRGQGCPQFSGWLEDLGRLKVAWEDCVKKHSDGESATGRRENAALVRLLRLRSGGVCHGCCFCDEQQLVTIPGLLHSIRIQGWIKRNSSHQ